MKRHTLKSNVMVLVLTLLASSGLASLGLTPAWAQTSEVEYYHTDAAGSVRMITDESGTAIERYDYTPFGKLLAGQAPSVGQPRGYAGKERDTDTGFDYFGGRYLQTEVSRFTTPDPGLDAGAALVDPQRWNRYTYVRNNPLRYTDPDGRFIDVIIDVASLAYNLYDIGSTVARGEGVTKTQLLSAGADLGAIFVPGLTGAGMAVRAASKADEVVDAAKAVNKAVQKSEKGGLNLFKWGQDTTTTAKGWREGDHMLNLPNQGSAKANWHQNAGRLRESMGKGKPIYDSYRDPVTGLQIPTKGFLNAERKLLESKGWKYDPGTGAYHPPSR